MDRVGARAFDLRAHRRQERGEVADLRLARGVLDDGLAVGAGRGHHEILGARHRDGVEHEPRAFELRRTRADVAVVDRDRRAHRAQPQDVQIHGPCADRAAARQRHVGMAESAEQRAEHENRRAHRLDELVGREELLDAGGVDGDAAVVAMLGRDSHAPAAASASSRCRSACGTLRSVTGPSASNVAARIGSAAFFAPEIRTSPSSGLPPTIASLSMARCPVADAERMPNAPATLQASASRGASA